MIHPFIIAPYRYIRQPAPTCSRACTRPRKHNGLFKMPFACLSWHLTHTTAHHGPPLTFAIRYHIMIVSSRCEKVDGWKRLPSSALYFSFLKLSFFLFFFFGVCPVANTSPLSRDFLSDILPVGPSATQYTHRNEPLVGTVGCFCACVIFSTIVAACSSQV